MARVEIHVGSLVVAMESENDSIGRLSAASRRLFEAVTVIAQDVIGELPEQKTSAGSIGFSADLSVAPQPAGQNWEEE